jgi:chromate transporter
LTPTTFGTAVAFGYLTPGPVLITATFVGQQVGGLLGALAATLGAFLAPWALSATAAQQVTRLAQSRWLRAFGAGAGPAVIGILGVTVLDVARESLVSWPYVAVSAAAFVLAARTRMHPIALLAAGAVLGWLVAVFCREGWTRREQDSTDHPDFTQEVAPNESQRGPKATT